MVVQHLLLAVLLLRQELSGTVLDTTACLVWISAPHGCGSCVTTTCSSQEELPCSAHWMPRYADAATTTTTTTANALTQPGDDEIRAAYRRRALVLHPDRQLGKPESKRAEMAAEFAALLRAYETLRDPDMRALYDAGELAEATLSL